AARGYVSRRAGEHGGGPGRGRTGRSGAARAQPADRVRHEGDPALTRPPLAEHPYCQHSQPTSPVTRPACTAVPLVGTRCRCLPANGAALAAGQGRWPPRPGGRSRVPAHRAAQPRVTGNVYTTGYTTGMLIETLSVREAREQLPRVLERFRNGDRTPVGVGSHRKTEAVMIPVEVYDELTAER